MSLSVSVCFCLSVSLCLDHVPHISDQFMAYTGNTDPAILLKDTFEPDPKVLTFKADEQRHLVYGLAHCSRPPETSISLWFTDCHFFAQYKMKMSWPKNVMHLLSSFSAFMDICGSTTSTSLPVTSTCQSGLTSGVCINMAARSLTMRCLAWDPRDQSAHLPDPTPLAAGNGFRLRYSLLGIVS